MNAKSFEYKGQTIEIRPTFSYDARGDRSPFLHDVYIDGLRRGGGFSQEREAELLRNILLIIPRTAENEMDHLGMGNFGISMGMTTMESTGRWSSSLLEVKPC
jgi:hypothetical protein